MSHHSPAFGVTGQLEKSSLDNMKQVKSGHSGHQGLASAGGHLDLEEGNLEPIFINVTPFSGTC